MPTPPPWWTLTQVAPAAVFTSALRIGQSAIASDPSRMASVSRYGDARERQSENPDALAGIIACLYQLNKAPEAIRYINQGVKSYPGNAWFPLEMYESLRAALTEACFELVEDGPMTRPDLTAPVLLRVSEPATG